MLNTLEEFFTINKYNVLAATDGLKGLELFNQYKDEIDIALIDVMLPFVDGLEVMTEIRQHSIVPVILLTAKDAVEDQLKGFELGADDYITKPYSLSVVKVHVEAVLKRVGAIADVITCNNIEIDFDGHKVYSNNKIVDTTPKEFELLCLFIKNQGKVFSRDVILDQIWGYHYGGDDRTVDTLIKQLRRKFGDELPLRTIYGVGYSLDRSENE